MPLDTAAFLVHHPEFTSTPTATVQAKLDEAYRRTPAKVWGNLQDDGARYLAAHLLALLPNARDMRVGAKEDLYHAERMRLVGVVASGFRVVGDTRGAEHLVRGGYPWCGW